MKATLFSACLSIWLVTLGLAASTQAAGLASWNDPRIIERPIHLTLTGKIEWKPSSDGASQMLVVTRSARGTLPLSTADSDAGNSLRNQLLELAGSSKFVSLEGALQREGTLVVLSVEKISTPAAIDDRTRIQGYWSGVAESSTMSLSVHLAVDGEQFTMRIDSTGATINGRIHLDESGHPHRIYLSELKAGGDGHPVNSLTNGEGIYVLNDTSLRICLYPQESPLPDDVGKCDKNIGAMLTLTTER